MQLMWLWLSQALALPEEAGMCKVDWDVADVIVATPRAWLAAMRCSGNEGGCLYQAQTLIFDEVQHFYDGRSVLVATIVERALRASQVRAPALVGRPAPRHLLPLKLHTEPVAKIPSEPRSAAAPSAVHVRCQCAEHDMGWLGSDHGVLRASSAGSGMSCMGVNEGVPDTMGRQTSFFAHTGDHRGGAVCGPGDGRAVLPGRGQAAARGRVQGPAGLQLRLWRAAHHRRLCGRAAQARGAAERPLLQPRARTAAPVWGAPAALLAWLIPEAAAMNLRTQTLHALTLQIRAL